MTSPNAELHANVVPDEALQALHEQAQKFLDNLIEHPVNSPGFQKNLAQIHSLGSALSNDLAFVLNHPTGGSEQKKLDEEVSAAMNALNELVRELTPNARTTLMGLFSGKKEFPYEKYFSKYERSQDTINTVIRGLLASRDSLLIENGRLLEEKEHVFNLFNKVNEHEVFVEVFLEELAVQQKNIQGKYSSDYISQYVNEVKLVLNQKRQDFLTLKTVTMQSYAALTVTHANNETLKHNLEHAKTVTVYALQTAYRVAQSVVSQKNMLTQIEGMTQDAEEGLMTLKHNMGKGVPKEEAVETLTVVFDKVSNAIGQYRDNVESMSQTEKVR